MNNFMPDASSIMTVISLITFIGIVWWTYVTKRHDEFSEAASLPFADEPSMEQAS